MGVYLNEMFLRIIENRVFFIFGLGEKIFFEYVFECYMVLEYV